MATAHEKEKSFDYAPAVQVRKIPDMPELKELTLLRAHFNRCEAILAEYGFGRYADDNNFVLLSHHYSVTTKFINSIRVTAIQQYGDDLAGQGETWDGIKHKLIGRFAKSETLHAEYQRRLARLASAGWSGHEACVDAARDAWRLGRTVSSHVLLQQQLLIRTVCKLLPVDVLRDVLRQVGTTPEWELEIEFDGDDGSSFLGAVSAAGRLLDSVNFARGHHSKAPVLLDAVKEASNPVPSRPKPSFSMKDFTKAIVVSCKKTAPADQLKRIESVLQGTTFRSYVSSRSKGYMVGLRTQAEYDKVTSQLQSTDCTVRDFVDRSNNFSPVPATSSPPVPATHSPVTAAPVKDSVARVAVSAMPNNLIEEYFVNSSVWLYHATNKTTFSPPALLQIDSGAGLDYLCLSNASRDELRTSGSIRNVEPFAVAQADGSHANVSEYVDARVTLFPADNRWLPIAVRDIRLYLLDSPGHSKPGILLGRSAIAQFDLLISKNGVMLSNGTHLMETRHCHSDRSVLFDCVKLAVHCTPVLPILDRLVAAGWSPLVRSPAYSIRLRQLLPSEPKDHSSQTHLFEIRVPKPTTGVDQSDSCIAQLSARVKGSFLGMSLSKRDTHKELTLNYEKLGWWKRTTIEECRRKSSFTPAPCFLIGGGIQSTKKPRVVVDFRPLNDTLPDSSTPGLTPAHLLAALRMTHPEAIVVADASAAFYKLHLCDDALWLVTAMENNGSIEIVHMLCSRVAFGVLFGPASLISSMSLLFMEGGRLNSLLKGFSGWYVDDNVIGGSISDVCTTLKYSSQLLRHCGHELQFAKCSAICVPNKRDSFADLLADIGQITVATTATVFGAVVEFPTDSSFAIKCNGANRKAALLKLAHSGDVKITKADIFAISGCLSYDVLKSHTDTKLLSDCLKSLIGRCYSDTDWKTPLDFTKLTPKKSECLQVLREWASELSLTNDCCHSTTALSKPADRHPTPVEICLYTDASTLGAGFSICSPDASGANEFWSDCWRWTGPQLNWHCNVLEFSTIERSLKPLVDILACLTMCTPPSTPRPVVKIFSDNRSAIKWTSLNSGELLAKHQSRHSIMRMVDSIASEWQLVRQHADTTIAHVSGVLNGRADSLSRYCFRTTTQVPSTGHLSSLLECEKTVKVPTLKEGPLLALIEDMEAEATDEVLNPPAADTDAPLADTDLDPEFKWYHKPATPDQARVVDHVNVVLSPDPPASRPWIEDLAATSYDLAGVYATLALMKKLLRAWGGKSGDTTATEDPAHTLARCAQSGLDRTNLPKALRTDVGPMFEVLGVFLVRLPLPTGEYRSVPLIPYTAPQTQSLIVRHYHRQVHHQGPDYTLARITDDFCLHKGRLRCGDVLTNCLLCRKRNAKRYAKEGFTMVHNRKSLLPYESIAIDHLALDNGIYCLTITCLSTGHTSWSLCDRTAEGTLVALKRILHRYSARPRYVLADAAVNLTCTMEAFQREFGTVEEFERTTAYSQFENGICERLHTIGCDILRCKLHVDRIKFDSRLTPLEIQDLLDLVCASLNTRPTGWYARDGLQSTKVPITPHLLVWGSSNLLLTTSPSVNHWREVFYSYYWGLLKQASERAVRGGPRQKHTFRINEPVLYYKASSKLAIPWRIAHVKDIQGNRLHLFADGKRFEQNSFNVCPLKPFATKHPYDVSRIGARVGYDLDNVHYEGCVIDDLDDELLIRWDPRDKTTWPDEWLPWDALAPTGGAC